MALTNVYDDGTFTWACAGCGLNQTAAVSDASVQWSDACAVQLPPCTSCGALCSVKAIFTQAEHQNTNMQVFGIVETPMELPDATTGQMVSVLVPAERAVGANPSIALNQKLAQLLQTAGKTYTPPA